MRHPSTLAATEVAPGRPRARFVPKALALAYENLLRAFGPQGWWPVSSLALGRQQRRLEIAVGAILTQNTSWKNVERALASLHRAGLMTVGALLAVSIEDLEQAVRSSGAYRVKARRLKAFVFFLHQGYEGRLSHLEREDSVVARQALLEVHGIGPETADAILLYAADKPTFVVDAYTLRIFRRHGWIGGNVGYAETQELVHRALPGKARVYNEFHALLVELGKRHCRRRARCEGCPLEHMPHDERR